MYCLLQLQSEILVSSCMLYGVYALASVFALKRSPTVLASHFKQEVK